MIYTYMYYKVSPKKFSEATHSLALFIEAVYTSIGIRPMILKAKDDPFTWMEVYTLSNPVPELPAILTIAAEKSGLIACLDSIRHEENFIPFSQDF